MQHLIGKVGIISTSCKRALDSIFQDVVDGQALQTFTDRAKVRAWLSEYLDLIAAKSPLEVVITFGAVARHVAENWPGLAPFKPARFFHLTHPTAPQAAAAPANWSGNLAAIGAQVAADAGVVPDLTPYAGPDFSPQDTARIPLRDFGFGAATWMGTGDMAARKDQGATRAILWTALANVSD